MPKDVTPSRQTGAPSGVGISLDFACLLLGHGYISVPVHSMRL